MIHNKKLLALAILLCLPAVPADGFGIVGIMFAILSYKAHKNAPKYLNIYDFRRIAKDNGQTVVTQSQTDEVIRHMKTITAQVQQLQKKKKYALDPNAEIFYNTIIDSFDSRIKELDRYFALVLNTHEIQSARVSTFHLHCTIIRLQTLEMHTKRLLAVLSCPMTPLLQ